jgi:ABA4-like protein
MAAMRLSLRLTGAVEHPANPELVNEDSESVSALFENPWALLAGWTHYLAFDLFIGGWEIRDAQRRPTRYEPVVRGTLGSAAIGDSRTTRR